MSWALKENLKKIIEKEQGCVIFPAGARTKFALVYPNSYFVGMSNLGMHILYREINSRKDTACERVFLPEKQELPMYERTRTALMSLETQTPLHDFSLIGFALSFEMDYFHVLQVLSMGKVPLKAKDRKGREPFIIAGGPCATFNPEPLSDFIDAFVIGEGEEIIQNFLDAYYQGKEEGLSRDEMLLRFAQVPGIYVPRFYTHSYAEDGSLEKIEAAPGVPEKVQRQWVQNLDQYAGHTAIVTEDTEFNLFLIEVARGCGRHCRFCMAGYCFRQPRNRSLEKLLETVKEALPYEKKIGLMGAAVSDYPEINALCADILARDLPMSVASFRADSVSQELVDSLVQSGLRTLTIAPEAGSEKMRRVINKGIEKEHLLRAIDMGIKAGVRNFRLYIMVGLPFEEDNDIDAIIEMAKELYSYMQAAKKGGKLTLSVNPFVPKPLTPFQWLPMQDLKTTDLALKKIKAAFKREKQIEVLTESTKEAYIQGVLARGDRRFGEVLLEAQKNGGSKGFKKALKEKGLDGDFYLYRTRGKEELFPWDCLDMGFSNEYLYKELIAAENQAVTVPCFDGCTRCGVCKQEGN